MKRIFGYLIERRAMLLIAVMLFFVFFPLFGTSFIIYLVNYALIFGIFAMAYDLFYGYAGLVSFGHSLFFGMAAYSVGIAYSHFGTNNIIILFALAIVVVIILATLVGFFCSFTKGIYLALVTFAFTQIFWLIVMADPWGITQGENGIVGIRPSPIHIGGLIFNLFSGIGLYYLTIAIFIFSYLIINSILNSQLGDIFKGIKQNEERLLSLGYNTRQYKILVFIFSGIFSGVAGVLLAFLNNCVTPSSVEWQLGAEILLITILGGPGTLIGPVIACFLVTFAKFYLSSWVGSGNWLYLLGGLYIFTVMFLPGGILNKRTLNSLQKSDK